MFLYWCLLLYVLADLFKVLFFFFFKQKTAYEMRISDWSSDVCSSDLCEHRRRQGEDRGAARRAGHPEVLARRPGEEAAGVRGGAGGRAPGARRAARALGGGAATGDAAEPPARRPARATRTGVGSAGVVRGGERGARSEEHTSELQSLMRISYAVFCLTN